MQLFDIKKLWYLHFYSVITSNDIGNCEDGKLLTCPTKWNVGWCHWDCQKIETLQQALRVESHNFITLNDEDEPQDRYGVACHYHCWKDCQPCPGIGNQNTSILFYSNGITFWSSKYYSYYVQGSNVIFMGEIPGFTFTFSNFKLVKGALPFTILAICAWKISRIFRTLLSSEEWVYNR